MGIRKRLRKFCEPRWRDGKSVWIVFARVGAGGLFEECEGRREVSARFGFRSWSMGLRAGGQWMEGSGMCVLDEVEDVEQHILFGDRYT